VVAHDALVVDEGRSLTFVLQNRSRLTVTAWTVRFTIFLDDGTQRRTEITRDGYAEFAGVRAFEPGQWMVAPNSDIHPRHLMPRSPSGRRAIRAEVELVCVVFADVTSFGSERDTAEILAARAQCVEDSARVRDVIQQSRAGLPARAALERALEELDTIPVAGPRPCLAEARSYLRFVVENARRASLTDGQVSEKVDSWLGAYEAQAAAASQHSIRRKGSLK
jgi:hypothetical protein